MTVLARQGGGLGFGQAAQDGPALQGQQDAHIDLKYATAATRRPVEAAFSRRHVPDRVQGRHLLQRRLQFDAAGTAPWRRAEAGCSAFDDVTANLFYCEAAIWTTSNIFLNCRLRVRAPAEIAAEAHLKAEDRTIKQCQNVASRMVQKNALMHSQAAYWVSIVVVQWADLLICKTRWLSIKQQGLRNSVLNFGLFFETLLAAWLCYGGIFSVLGTQPIRFTHWMPGVPWSMMIFMYDETRKYVLSCDLEAPGSSAPIRHAAPRQAPGTAEILTRRPVGQRLRIPLPALSLPRLNAWATRPKRSPCVRRDAQVHGRATCPRSSKTMMYLLLQADVTHVERSGSCRADCESAMRAPGSRPPSPRPDRPRTAPS